MALSALAGSLVRVSYCTSSRRWAPTTPANGLLMPASKRGFCRSKADSKVEPEHGSPEMKCMCAKSLPPVNDGVWRAGERRTFAVCVTLSVWRGRGYPRNQGSQSG
jgi:hypothetical protein